MEKYSLNEGNESLKRILLMMDYDSKKTLEENHKNIFEQDMDNDVDPKLTNSLVQPVATTTPTETTPPETPLSYKDAVTKLQNLLMTKYNADFGKYGADGKLGPLTLTALNNAIKTKLSKTVTEPPKEIEGGDDKKTNTITPDNQITPESNVSVTPGSIEDWA